MRLTIFASGSTGNCALLRGGGRSVLIDAGLSARRITRALADAGCTPGELDGIFITHEHSDHVSGLAVLCRHDPIPVYAPGTVANHLRWSIPGVEACLRELRPEEPLTLDGLTVTAFPTPHDTDQSVGYRFCADGAALGFATDTGCVTDVMRRYLAKTDAAVIEANHDETMLRYGRYPAYLKRRILSERGHLSNERCAELAAYLAQNGAHDVILAHLSRENNTPRRALEAVSPALAGTDAVLHIAPELGCLELEVSPCFA